MPDSARTVPLSLLDGRVYRQRKLTSRSFTGHADLGSRSLIAVGGDLFADKVIDEPTQTSNQHDQEKDTSPAQPQSAPLALSSAPFDDILGEFDPIGVVSQHQAA